MEFRFPIALAVAAAAMATVAARSEAVPDRPHIILFFVDDLGWRDLGCTGSEVCETPNVDALAGDGVRFAQAYSAASVCSPTRASLMTGKHPVRVGITDWIPGMRAPEDAAFDPPEDADHLALEEVTIGEALRDRGGYATFYAGKWHLGGRDFGPDRQGFDSYFDPHSDPAKGSPARRPDGGRRHATDEITEEAIRFLQSRAAEGPVFMVISYFDVHTPIVADEKHVGRFRKKAGSFSEATRPTIDEHGAVTRGRQDNPEYASMVAAVDDSVGDVMAAARELGLSESTIVLFTSDNGGLSTLRRGPGPTCNLPLRAGKGWLYEGGIRVPLIVSGAAIPAALRGSVTETPAVTMDLYPTILELAGLPAMPEQHADGVSLAGAIRGGAEAADSERTLFWHYPHYHGSGWKPGAAIRRGPWKMIEFLESGESELYRLDLDPGEQINLADSEPETVDRLAAELGRRRETAER